MSIFSIKIFTLLVLSFVGLFICLGVWQLHRADEKKSLLMQYANRQKESPVMLESLKELPQNYQQIQVKGVYRPKQSFFLDNQFYQHQLGYEVIEPMLLPNKKILLVSLGWVKAPESRQQLPSLSLPEGKKSIQGVAYFPQKGFTLGKNVDNATAAGWPMRIEYLHIEEIRKWLGKEVYSFILRLDPKNPNGFIRDWPITVMSPQRHLGYAIQWFTMAIALVVIFMFFAFKKKKCSSK